MGARVVMIPSIGGQTAIMASDVTDWLKSHGLEQYADEFRREDISLASLPHLTEADLRELGVSLGHRKVLLAAIRELSFPPPDRPVHPAAEIDPPAPSGQAEHRLVTVFFCDMVGSTRRARHLGPEDMRELLRDYQDRVAGVVARYGGHLAQYLGDGVMAFFGWPVAFEDQAERAVRAGLEALEAIRKLPLMGGEPTQGRIAIATGPVVIGDLGQAGRMEGAIAGETPNLAARLQQYAEPDQLVVSETTHDLVARFFETRELPAQAAAGFDQPIRLFRIEGARRITSRFDATRRQRLSRFVGRRPELSSVLEKWEAAKAGEGQAVLIAGEAGIGKSRFIRTIADRINQDAHASWWGQCSPYHTSSALFPLVEALSNTLGTGMEHTASASLDRLEELLGSSGLDSATIAPLLAETLSLDFAGRYRMPDLPAKERRSLVLTAFVELWRAMAQDAPLLLVIEDMHWSDPTTREVIEQTVARIAGDRILLLISHRPDWSATWASEYDNVATVTLGRLSRSQVTELVSDLLGPEVDDQLVSAIAMRTDGVPMFVEEVARAIAEAGGQQGTVDLSVPMTLRAALTARLDTLSPMARAAIQTASVMGREFDPLIVARVSGLSDAEMDAALDEMVRERLATRAGSAPNAVSFRHALIQEAAYQTLLRGRRRHLHQAIAREIAHHRPTVSDTQPELLARHLVEADLPAEALPLWRRAGERALRRHDSDEAVLHFEKALQAAEQLPIVDDRGREVLASQLSLARALMVASMLPESLLGFQRAADLARSRDDTPSFVAAALGFDRTEFSTNAPVLSSLPLLREALGRVDEGRDGTDLCHLLCQMARAMIMSGHAEQALPYSRRAADMARRIHDDQTLADVLIHDFLVPRPGYHPSQRQDIDARLSELLGLAYRLGDLDLMGRSIATSFSQWAEIGDRHQMEATLAQWSEFSDARKYVVVQWLVRHARAMVAMLDGDWGAAETLASQALEMGRRSHGDQAQGVFGIQMFTIQRERGRLAMVAPVIKRLIEDRPDASAWRPGFALIASDLGYADTAREILGQLAADGFTFPLDAKRSTSLAYLAETCAALGETGHAETLYGLLLPYQHMTITSGVAIVCYGSAQRYLGLLAATLGAWNDAAGHFEAAISFNRSLRSPPWLAHAQCDHATLLLRQGRASDRRTADILIEEASGVAQRLGMAALQDRLRRLRP